MGYALEFCPADPLPEILAAWRRLEKDITARQHASDGMDLLPLIKVAAAPPLLRNTEGSALRCTCADTRTEYTFPPISPLVMADGADMVDTFNHVTSRFPFAKSRPQVRDE